MQLNSNRVITETKKIDTKIARESSQNKNHSSYDRQRNFLTMVWVKDEHGRLNAVWTKQD